MKKCLPLLVVVAIVIFIIEIMSILPKSHLSSEAEVNALKITCTDRGGVLILGQSPKTAHYKSELIEFVPLCVRIL